MVKLSSLKKLSYKKRYLKISLNNSMESIKTFNLVCNIFVALHEYPFLQAKVAKSGWSLTNMSSNSWDIRYIPEIFDFSR